MMSQGRRYFTEPIAWLEQDGRLLALNQQKPAWGSVNQAAAWILGFCDHAAGRTAGEVRRGYVGAIGPASEDDIARALADLEAAGLLRSAAEEGQRAASLDPAPAWSSDYRVEHLYIELLARCNLRCIHCYMEGSPQRRERLEGAEVVDLLRQFRDADGRYVTLSGGEPLIYPGFHRIAREVADQGFNGTVITNGTVLREQDVSLLDELGFHVAISLDGASPETNDRIRGAGTYRKVVRTIDAVLNTVGPDRVTLSITPNKLNIGDLPELFAFAKRRGIRRLNLSLIEKVGRGVSHWSQLALSESEREQLMTTVYQAALDLVGEVEIDFNDTRNILEVFATDRHPSELHPLWRGVRIDSVGNCYPSTFGSEPQFLLGNIRDAPLMEVLASPVLQELYGLLLDRFYRIPQCSSCIWRQLCRGGGVTSTYYATGDLFRPDLYCAGYLKMFPRVAVALAELGSKRG